MNSPEINFKRIFGGVVILKCLDHQGLINSARRNECDFAVV
ncbi:hypothetical protein IMAU80100_00499 [Lactiplantibacillus plantarum]|jgi:hypothetical protein|uniref:Uncharacterized protein n=3 Tax=Lactiplantibacillus plantarum TaxID=1590 RepID=A0A2S3U8V6_LACPN|nr:Hypothetical protein LBP_cg1276 [Lactiplantibacillus plantarum subsp. plantarum P-8]AGO07967.1 Hypothetical protein Lp16_1278 [Lactiplantibacillus plantarum 16]ALC08621.1 hypothetical protein JM48_1413 [Lactiplantibacillus plantarum]POD88755.1 hypothetical protein S101258_00518 [Lactiplantibacillus plantarum subsp. plantarum]KZU43589.1 hypothetical protein Nizo2753_0463 [Lactiplantibacillus plantarum]